MKTLINKYEYTLYENEAEELVLTAVYGTSVELALDVKLTPQETAAFRREGTDFMDRLADDIRSDAGKYKFRRLKYS